MELKKKENKNGNEGKTVWGPVVKVSEVHIDMDKMMGKEISEDIKKKREFIKRANAIILTDLAPTQEGIEKKIMAMKEELLRTELKEEWRAVLASTAKKKGYSEFIAGVEKVLDMETGPYEFKEIKETCIEQMITIGTPELMGAAEKMIESIDYELTRATMFAKLAKRKMARGDKDGKKMAVDAWDLIKESIKYHHSDIYDLNEVATALSMAGMGSAAIEIYKKMDFFQWTTLGSKPNERMIEIIKGQMAVNLNEPMRFLEACREDCGRFRLDELARAALHTYAEAGMKEQVKKVIEMLKKNNASYAHYYYHARAGMLEKALEDMSKEEEDSKRWVVCDILTGLADAGSMGEARKIFETVIKGTREERGIIAVYIRGLARAGYTEEAEECYKKYRNALGEGDYSLQEFEALLGIAEAKADGDIEKAVQCARELKEWNRENSSSYYDVHNEDSRDIRMQRVAEVIAKIAKNAALMGDMEKARELFKEASDLSHWNEGDKRGQIRYAGRARSRIVKMQASVGMFKEALEAPDATAFGLTVSVKYKLTLPAVEGYLEFLAGRIRKAESS